MGPKPALLHPPRGPRLREIGAGEGPQKGSRACLPISPSPDQPDPSSQLTCRSDSLPPGAIVSVTSCPYGDRERKRERNINDERESLIGCLLHLPRPTGDEPTTLACALDRNRTQDPLGHGPMLYPVRKTG
ncbi:hypothetical protein MDA_GLEAN10011078 [Myotis davidii]|uniref:Uncharacterized protein n=1 Tax=Myotis davidii TaxID=225400 RepID=L5M7L0_MYODS|nr:hypothetical protein MDA_GLEAN10011078 [Myotis davidii]